MIPTFRPRGFCINSNSGSPGLLNPWAIQCKPQNQCSFLNVDAEFTSTSLASNLHRKSPHPPKSSHGILPGVAKVARPPKMSPDGPSGRPAGRKHRRERDDSADNVWTNWLEEEKFIMAEYAWNPDIDEFSHDTHPPAYEATFSEYLPAPTTPPRRSSSNRRVRGGSAAGCTYHRPQEGDLERGLNTTTSPRRNNWSNFETACYEKRPVRSAFLQHGKLENECVDRMLK